MKLKDVKGQFDCVHCGKKFPNALKRKQHEDNLQYVCPAWKDKPGARTDRLVGYYVVYFDVLDSHLNGSSLVNARSESEAKKILQRLGHDAGSIRVTYAEPLATYIDEMEFDVEEFWNDLEGPPPGPGDAVDLEVGS